MKLALSWSCQLWEVAVGHEDVYLHSSLIKKVTDLQSKWHPIQNTSNPNDKNASQFIFSGICVLVLPFWTVLEEEWPMSTGKRLNLTTNGTSSKRTSKNQTVTLRFESVLRHEGGIIAAKYDQPGYVHAMRLVAKDDIWAQQYIISLLLRLIF